MIDSYIEVYRGELLTLMAMVTPDLVRFGLLETSQLSVGNRAGNTAWWKHKQCGFTSPENKWWGSYQPSIGEAMQEVMSVLHRQEFLMREAESQVNATRATIKALAEIEKELSA